MTKVTLQTPTEKILDKKNAQMPSQVVDSLGRVIKLRPPDVLDEFDLSSALGNDSSNLGCVALAGNLLYVVSIDDEAFPQPKSYEQVRAAIKRLGREGMQAIMSVTQAYAKELAGDQEQIETIKK